jgi:arylsulfatase A-like enzyme/Flp pilus assembly protein TadD
MSIDVGRADSSLAAFMPVTHPQSRPASALLAPVVVAVIAFACAPAEQPATPPTERTARSLLLVTLDTMRADRLEPYGARDVATPVLGGLARDGIVIEQALATTPVTLPSHASILTGLYPGQHGVHHNTIHYLPEEVTTLAEILQRQGLRTAAFVSAAPLERLYGLAQGFEVYDDDLSSGKPRSLRMVAERTAGATVDRALAWLDDLEGNERFFLWIHLFDPHAGYEPPPPFDERYSTRPYDGEIAYVDAELGRLLDHDRLAGARDLAVAVLGDHGESLGEHGEETHGLLAYEATLRIPWILRLPGGPRGRRLAGPASQVDLLPTVLDLFGLPFERELPGESILGWIDGEPGEARSLYAESFVAFYTYGWAKLRVLRAGRWKYVDAPAPELYDLVTDPGEERNLAGREESRVRETQRTLVRLSTELGEREAVRTPDSAARERLRSLGYLSGGGSGSERAGPRPDPKGLVDLHGRMQQAEDLLFRRHLEAAIAVLDDVLARDPQNLAALENLGLALADAGRIDEAAASLDEALHLDPESPSLWLARARVEEQAGRLDDALELVERSRALDSRFVDAMVAHADLLHALGRSEQAAGVLEEAIELSPDHPTLHVRYAQLVEMPRGDLDAAESRLRTWVAREPFIADGWIGLAQLLERRGQMGAAEDAYREGLRRQPRDPRLHTGLGALLAELGRAQEAEEALREAIRLSAPSTTAPRALLADLLRRTGGMDEAEALYRQVLAHDPDHHRARHGRALLLIANGNLDAGADALSRLVRDAPDDVAVLTDLSLAAVQQGRNAYAEETARRAVELEPGRPEAWNSLGMSLEEQGRGEAALAAYERAVAELPSYWQARFNAGLLLRRLHRSREAAAAFAAVLEQVPAHAAAHFELGALYAGALADREQARRHYQAAIRAAPEHPRAAEARRLLRALGGE